MLRKIGWVVLGLGAVIVVAAVTFVVWLETARPQVDGRLRLAGLSAPVQVWRDSMGVPHIWARTEEDLLFAQGFVHAQDRLWQMELLRRVAQGRLAEALGPDVLDSDRFLRTLGIWRAATTEEAALTPEERGRLQAYANGVNAFLRTRPGALPPELVLLRVHPGPWTVRDCIAMEKVMSFDLSEYHVSVAAWAGARRLGPQRAGFVLPSYPSWGTTILEATPPPPVPAAAAALLGAASVVRASNSWVVDGRYTRSGKPILANDMHLQLQAPSIWELMALHGGGLDVVGMTLPGAPYVIAGHNRAIAWGYTNAMLDDADLFLERRAPGGGFVGPGGVTPARSEVELIPVRGRPPARLTIEFSAHGPLLDQVLGSAETVSLRWASADAAHSIRGIGNLNRARDWPDFLAAVRDFQDPHQNVIFADTAGHIGYAMGGRVPLRGSPDPTNARTPPVLPVPGWTGGWDWKGYLPFELHPQVLDPADGYVVTANNRQDTSASARLITADWMPPWRAARIREMIRGGGARAPGPAPGGGLAQPEMAPAHAFDAAAILRMQLDVHDALAERYRGRAIEAAESAGLRAVAAELRAWDGAARADSHAAAVFESWVLELGHLEAVSLYGAERPGYFPASLQDRTLEERRLPWDQDPAAYGRLAVQAMRAADSVARGKRWGELNHVTNAHALASARPLAWLLRLNVGPAPRGGSPATVNVSDWSGGLPPVTTPAGPSQRHVVDMGDVDGSGGFILPTGESGLPFEPHYRDMFPAWRDGGLWRIPLGAAQARARTVHFLTLTPERAVRSGGR